MGNAPIIPHLEQYADTWAMYEPHFRSTLDHVNSLDLVQHARQAVQSDAIAMDENMIRVGDIAVINLVGFMTKYGSSLSELRGGTVSLRRSIRQAAADEDVRAILLKIDSPGGAVAGTSDLAQDVFAARQAKPVWAYIEDLGASAAYWVASQAMTIIANPGAVVGSIGTYGVLYDYSGAYAAAGVKAVVIRSAEFKGIGVQGTEITAEQKAVMQETTDQIHALFVQGIASGRGLSADKAAELADGRVYVGRNALDVGLVDKIGTFDAVLNDLAQVVGPQTNRSRTMAKDETTQEAVAATAELRTTEPVAVTIEQLKAACPGADAEFLCSQLEGKASVEQATNAWMGVQQKRLDAETKRADAAEAKAKSTEAKATDIDGVGTAQDGSDGDGDGSVKAQWDDAVNEKVKAGMTRVNAVRAVAKSNPAMRLALIDEANARR